MICGVKCYFHRLDKRSIRACRPRPSTRIPVHNSRLEGILANNNAFARQPAKYLRVCMLLGNSALDLITVGIKVYSRARHC
jgi:hypothetical protein